MSGAENNPPSLGGGHFFAIDRRAWARVCDLGLVAAITYLMLARGSGEDQRTSFWSVNAIEKYTGIGRPRAKAAIRTLLDQGLVTCAGSTTRPRYRLVPAHEVPGAEGFLSLLTEPERKLLAELTAGPAILRERRTSRLGFQTPREVGHSLVLKGYARHLGENCFEAVPGNRPETEPDWIWLPNALIDGVPGNVTAPVELLRQTQNLGALRLLIHLYHAHMLQDDGGIHWSRLRVNYRGGIVAECKALTIHGFKSTLRRETDPRLAAPFMTGKLVARAEGGGADDSGWPVFWQALDVIEGLGLLDYVGHVVETAAADAEIIHPYAIGTGEPEEQAVAAAAHAAASAILTSALTSEEHAEIARKGLHLFPLRKHRAAPQMVGVARLRYRPRTRATAAWRGGQSQWTALAKELRALEQRFRGQTADLQHQG
jgi:hypothetical protein